MSVCFLCFHCQMLFTFRDFYCIIVIHLTTKGSVLKNMKKFTLKVIALVMILALAVCPVFAAFTPTASNLDPIPKVDDVIVRFAV